MKSSYQLVRRDNSLQVVRWSLNNADRNEREPESGVHEEEEEEAGNDSRRRTPEVAVQGTNEALLHAAAINVARTNS